MKRFRPIINRTVCAIVVALLGALSSAHAAAPGWVQVTTTNHGIQLTLFIRHSSYPQNALVRIWARMQNVTSHRLYFVGEGPQAAGQYIPQAVVLATPDGQPLPISLTDYLPYPGPPPMPVLLAAGAVRHIPEIVILRGPLVRLDLTLAIGGRIPVRSGPTISTPLLHLTLTAPDTPAVTLRVPPAQPSADITPVDPVRGPLLAVWYQTCATNAFPSATAQNIYWTAISRHIGAACSPLLGWHEIAGWLNHSVAQINWGQR